MKNKKLFITIVSIFLLVLLLLLPVIYESQKIIKFVTSYWLFEKYNIAGNGNMVNSCYFTEMRLKNDVEIKCKAIKPICYDKIPNEKYINKDNACALITFDINGFDKKPNMLSSYKNIKDQYQVLIYNNGMVTIPNSVEFEALNSRRHSFKRRIQSIILFSEVAKDVNTYKAAKNYRK